MDRSIERFCQTLADRFAAGFSVGLSAPGDLRTVGREAEFPIVTADGVAADCARLWPLLQFDDLHPKYDAVNENLVVGLNGPDYSYALEVGRGTMEINTRPCATLVEVEALHDRAVQQLVEAAAALNWRVLAYGIQPVSPPTHALLSPKQRYLALFDVMGDEWLWYTVTASDQTQVSIARTELIRQINVANLMAPIIIGFCAHSPIYAGERSPFCSAREGVAQMGTFANRHGMPPRPYTDLLDLVERLVDFPFLLRREDRSLQADGRPFVTYLAQNGPDLDAFLLHEHYIWHSARLRHAYGTIEIRPACQQPWSATVGRGTVGNETMAAAALCLGIVEAADELWDYVRERLGEDFWQIMRVYHDQVIREGLAAPEPATGFLAGILARVEEGLAKRGAGEVHFLDPLHKRLEQRQNPAQRMHRIFQEGGMTALMDVVTIPSSNLNERS